MEQTYYQKILLKTKFICNRNDGSTDIVRMSPHWRALQDLRTTFIRLGFNVNTIAGECEKFSKGRYYNRYRVTKVYYEKYTGE